MTAEAFLLGVVVFVAAALYDAIFAAYVRFAASGQAMKAALSSVLTYGVGAVGLLALVKVSIWYSLPEAAGLYTGTMVGVWAGRDKD